ncbi:unnamed protein product, partial [Mycena citricolor]
THHVVALVQSIAVRCVSWDSSESTRGLSIFEDEDWFRAAIRIDDEKWIERGSTPGDDDAVPVFVRSCALFGVVTTFLEQCAQNREQRELELDFKTLTLIIERAMFSGLGWSLVLPSEIQRRFAAAVSTFLQKYPQEGLAEGRKLGWLLYSAITPPSFRDHWGVEVPGWINDLVALQVLD